MGIVKIIDAKFQKAKETKVVKDLKSVLFFDAVKYEKGRLNRQDLQDFCKLMTAYCKLTRHKDAILPTPIVKFSDLESSVIGRYTGGERNKDRQPIAG